MKVAFVITRSDVIGGASAHVRDLAVALRAAGHEAVVLVGGRGEVTAQLDACGVPSVSLRHLVRPVAPWHDVQAVGEIARVLAQVRPDLVAAHSPKAGVTGLRASRRLHVPAVFTAHNWARPALTVTTPLYRRVERHIVGLATRVIAVSEAVRDQAVDSGIARADRFSVIHNGIPDVAATLRARGGGRRLIMIGRMERQKDHGLLLRALAGLRELEWDLDLVGGGPLERALRAEAEALGLAARIRFLGARRDVAELLAGASVAVLASRFEGLPLSVLEAMRAGLPVVATDAGGTGEAVRDGVTGALVPAGDVAAMRAAISSLLADEGRRAAWGRAGRQAYEERFTLEVMVSRTLRLYQEVLAA